MKWAGRDCRRDDDFIYRIGADPQTDGSQGGDPAMLEDVYGAWEIQDAQGRETPPQPRRSEERRRHRSPQIDFAKDCAKTFPVIDDIARLRLYGGGTIGFADATSKSRIRFPTPDNSYVAEPQTGGIFIIVKK
jgi:hypothetical protein